MSLTNNRFEKSDVKTRKMHKVVLTADSPASTDVEIELLASQVVHIEPSERALEAKAERNGEALVVEKEAIPVETPVTEEAVEETVAEEVVETTPAPAVEETVAEETATEEPSVEETPVVAAAPAAPAANEEPAEPAKPVYENLPPLEDRPLKRRSRFRLSLTQRKALSGWIFVLPFIIGILFIYGPIVVDSIVISLSDVKLVPGGMQLTWNDFGNYAYLFAEDGDPYFSITIVDGIKDLILQIPAIVIFALFMAIILNQKMTGRAAFRAIFFLPVILSTGIIDSIDTNSAFMNAVSNSQGGVDDNTGAEGGGGIISAMDLEQLLGGIKIGTELVDYVVGLVNSIFDIVSRSGVQMLIFLSGLQSISPSIYESCEVEGASAWETFWKITLPMISPMILVNAIYTVIDAFTAADNRVMIYIEKIYSGAGPGYARSSAMSWIYVGIVLMFIVLVALIMKTVVFYQKRD